MKTVTRENRLFAEILVREGMAPPDTVKRALEIQARTGELLEEVLVEEGIITEWDIARVLVKHYKLPFLSLNRYSIPKKVLDVFPVDFLREQTFVPLDRFGTTVTLAIGRHPQPGLKERIQQDFQMFPSLFVSTLTDVKNALNLHFPTPFSEFDNLLTDVKKSFRNLGDWSVEGNG